MSEIIRSIPNTADSVADFHADTTVDKPRQTVYVITNQVSKDVIETGVTKEQS